MGVTAAGTLAGGEHTSHTLDLTLKAQNDVYVLLRDSAPTGTSFRVYVTSATCTTFSPGAQAWELRYPVIPQDPCAIISSGTVQPLIGSRRYGTSGPGAYVMVRDHEVSGASQFKLWIIGDPRVPIAYDVKVMWGSGHDC
jgi:hypothetical protein